MKAITRGGNQVVEMLLADPRTNINQCSGRAGLTVSSNNLRYIIIMIIGINCLCTLPAPPATWRLSR